MLNLQMIKRTDPRILENMSIHYSQPKGFVGRNICYAVLYDGIYYGSTSSYNNLTENNIYSENAYDGIEYQDVSSNSILGSNISPRSPPSRYAPKSTILTTIKVFNFPISTVI